MKKGTITLLFSLMDWCTGELIRHLEELGLSENTLVIFSSDNGQVLGS